MAEDSYLRWLASQTPTTWWHDSAHPDELKLGLSHGATGVTTNPVLTHTALVSDSQRWDAVAQGLPSDLDGEARAETLMGHVVRNVARMLEPQYESTQGKLGYVCAQVNPARAAEVEAMISMAKRFASWAPNIAVKLPVTAAGLDALEECVTNGVTITATVSFTVPQVVALAERYCKGVERARQAGRAPGRCFAVIMIGRLDDYLWDVVRNGRAQVSEADITQAGLAVTKRAYAIFKERDYEPTLIVAALRGTYHMSELAGAELIMSVHPQWQMTLLAADMPRQTRIDQPVAPDVIERLMTLPEFVRSYEPEGMAPEEFITFGATQRTLTQFSEAGWQRLEAHGASPESAVLRQ